MPATPPPSSDPLRLARNSHTLPVLAGVAGAISTSRPSGPGKKEEKEGVRRHGGGSQCVYEERKDDYISRERADDSERILEGVESAVTGPSREHRHFYEPRGLLNRTWRGFLSRWSIITPIDTSIRGGRGQASHDKDDGGEHKGGRSGRSGNAAPLRSRGTPTASPSQDILHPPCPPLGAMSQRCAVILCQSERLVCPFGTGRGGGGGVAESFLDNTLHVRFSLSLSSQR